MAALPRHPGPAAPMLNAAGNQRLLAYLVAQPDATLAESLALLAAEGPATEPHGCVAGPRTIRLGPYTPPASSILVIAVAGGAVSPYLMGKVANHDIAAAYYLPIICYACMALFRARLCWVR